MTARDEIRKRVEALRTSVIERRGDEETWHGEEDAIMGDALQAIANGAADPRGIAREAVAPSKFKFSRWYA